MKYESSFWKMGLRLIILLVFVDWVKRDCVLSSFFIRDTKIVSLSQFRSITPWVIGISSFKNVFEIIFLSINICKYVVVHIVCRIYTYCISSFLLFQLLPFVTIYDHIFCYIIFHSQFLSCQFLIDSPLCRSYLWRHHFTLIFPLFTCCTIVV